MRPSASRVLFSSILALFAIPANADPFGESLAAKHATPCFQQAAPLIVTDILQRDLRGYLEGLANGRKLPAGWQPGNPHYDEAFAALNGAVLAEEQKNGPLATIDMKRFFARGFSLASEQQRASIVAFLDLPAGKFAWEYIVDDASCMGIVDSLERRHVVFPEGQQALLQSLKTRGSERRKILEARIVKFSAADQAYIDTSVNMIMGLMMKPVPGEKSPPNRFGVDGLVLIEKLGEDFGGSRPRVVALMDAFAKEAAK